MRLTFFLLLLANLIFFAWTQGYLGNTDAGREPQRLGNQLAPEKLRIMATGEKSAKPLCRVVTGLAAEAAEGLKVALAGTGIAADIKPADEAPRFWVVIPSQPNLAAAEKKATELRKLGVTEFSMLAEPGPNRLGLLLGRFGTEAEANRQLQVLAKRGVRSAKVSEQSSPPPSARVTVRGAAATVNARLPELLAKLPEAKVGDCP